MKLAVIHLALCLAFIGCSSRQDKWQKLRPPVVKAAGVVTLNGTPLEKATVTFHPVSSNHAAFAVTDSKGQFSLTTYVPNDGAVAGDYSVTVTKSELDYQPDPIDPNTRPPLYQAEQSVVPDKYLTPASSGLAVNVPKSGDAKIELILSGEPGTLKVVTDRRGR